jgi:hypothetical protein
MNKLNNVNDSKINNNKTYEKNKKENDIKKIKSEKKTKNRLIKSMQNLFFYDRSRSNSIEEDSNDANNKKSSLKLSNII